MRLSDAWRTGGKREEMRFKRVVLCTGVRSFPSLPFLSFPFSYSMPSFQVLSLPSLAYLINSNLTTAVHQTPPLSPLSASRARGLKGPWCALLGCSTRFGGGGGGGSGSGRGKGWASGSEGASCGREEECTGVRRLLWLLNPPFAVFLSS